MIKTQTDKHTREQFHRLTNQSNVFAEGENEKLTVFVF